MATSRIAALKAAVEAEFPTVRSLGVTNCRKIAGSENWSQHAWSNAWDITSDVWLDDRVLSDEHYALMDAVFEWLMDRVVRFEIDIILWRVTNHYNHIHVQCEPRREGLPTCAGGPADVDPPYTDPGDDMAITEENQEWLNAFAEASRTVFGMTDTSAGHAVEWLREWAKKSGVVDASDEVRLVQAMLDLAGSDGEPGKTPTKVLFTNAEAVVTEYE